MIRRLWRESRLVRRLAVAPDGRPRFDLLRVATHVDALMLGRRSVPHPRA